MEMRLLGMKEENERQLERVKEETEMSDESNILHATRSAGITFAQSFNYLIEGALSSEHGRMTMEQELRAFHRHCEATGSLTQEQKTVEAFSDLDNYIAYLR